MTAVVPAAMLSPAAAAPGIANTPSDAARERDERPFAGHRLVLQLSDGDPVKHRLVLSVAYNMLEVYGVDLIAIEVVVFAEGIGLLDVDGQSRPMVDSLVAQGVTFDACGKTLRSYERTSGRAFRLNPKARTVEAGVATILSLVEAGYTLVRP